MKTFSLGCLAWALLGLSMLGDVGMFASAGVDLEEVKKFVNANSKNGTAFTHSQLEQWFNSLIPKEALFEEYPRLWPFCITAAHIEDTDKRRTKESDHIKHYLKIFQDIEAAAERFYEFNKTLHSTLFNNGWITDISLTRINTPEMDMVNLRQWLHIKVTTKDEIKGLYIQNNVGPMGLPFGEFNLEFPCVDDGDLNTTKNIAEVGQLTHCTYRPRATILHPSSYVGYSKEGSTEWHSHFLWTDITCMETPYVQFLLLAVKDFDKEPKIQETYQPIFSPVYLNKDFDSRSGAPFPYYPEWKDNMYCFQTNATFDTTYTAAFGSSYPSFPSTKVGADAGFAPINFIPSDTAFRIQPSEVYDRCITTPPDKKFVSKFGERNLERLECPPGPFKCLVSYANTTSQNKTVDEIREELIENENRIANCSPCAIPACSKLDFPVCASTAKLTTNTFFQADQLETAERHNRTKVHGLLAILAFLVIMPLANYMGRFFKEVCGGCLCNNGPWIFVHIILHLLALAIVWLSLGPVTSEGKEIIARCKQEFGNDDNQAYRTCIAKEGIANPHIIVGIVAITIQICVVLASFFRSSNNKVRTIQVALHTHFGYMSWLLSAVSIFTGYGTACLDVTLVNAGLLLLPLVFSAAALGADIFTDRLVGIIPRRRQWPTLEPVKLEGRRGPCTMLKWILFIAFAMFQCILWIIAVASSTKISQIIEDILQKLGDGQVDPKSLEYLVDITNESIIYAIPGIISTCDIEISQATIQKSSSSSTSFVNTTDILSTTPSA